MRPGKPWSGHEAVGRPCCSVFIGVVGAALAGLRLHGESERERWFFGLCSHGFGWTLWPGLSWGDGGVAGYCGAWSADESSRIENRAARANFSRKKQTPLDYRVRGP